MGKIKDDVSMVNIYYVIKLLGRRAGATADSILRCFMENTLATSREVWRKIKKKLNLGVIAKIFKYSHGRYWVADDDPDAEVVVPPTPPSSSHSSLSSTPRHGPDGSTSDTSLVATPPDDVDASTTSPPPRWLGEYLRLHVHSMRTERALQRCKILEGVKEHYATKRRYAEAQRRRIVLRRCRDASACRRRRATYRRAPNAGRRRRRLAGTRRLRTRQCDDRRPCVAYERNHKAVIERLSRDVAGVLDVPRTFAGEPHDIFENDLNIDFSPNSTRQYVHRTPSSHVPSSSKNFGIHEENRSKDDTLGHTLKTNAMITPSQYAHRTLSSGVSSSSKSFGTHEEISSKDDTSAHVLKTNATIKPPKPHELQDNALKLESLNINTTPSTAHRQDKSVDVVRSSIVDRAGFSKSPQKQSCQPKGAELIRSLGMENLVTVVNNPLNNRRKLSIYRKDGTRSDDHSTELGSLLQAAATKVSAQGTSGQDSDDEDLIPTKRFRRTT